jgi:hypothetical protein
MGTPTWRTTYKQELIFKSPNTGNPFQNTAGDPLAGITEDKPYWTLNYSWSARSRPRWIKEYAAAINSDDIRLDGDNFGKYQVLMGELEIAPEVDEEGTEYRRILLQILTHPEKEGWIREFPNVGYYEVTKKIYARYVTGQPTQVLREAGRYRIEDDTGEVERPAWLDKDGAAIRETYNYNNPRHQDTVRIPLKMPLDDKDFIWIKCDTRKKLPFGPLGLKKYRRGSLSHPTGEAWHGTHIAATHWPARTSFRSSSTP